MKILPATLQEHLPEHYQRGYQVALFEIKL